ncbi:hypothetical protein CGC50_08890 [Capnocytophaga gingivalis]|uniref:Uncharacterized protein n=1 Tax=Capnocytophaga gingivalis TaxID=1017 RepID=A0A250FTI4_9FLAO|nr:hypothetical protein CGC50_08890 [Capnocytophaga gingivalis]
MNLNKIIHSRILNITIDKLIKANAYNPLLGLVLITIALFVFFIVGILLIIGLPILGLVNLFKKLIK